MPVSDNFGSNDFDAALPEFHWKESKILIRDGVDVDCFLARYLLQWLEALSIIGRLSESVGMIGDLLGCLSKERSKNASAFLHDTQRLILAHRSAIDQWPLQIDFSAIIFAPQQSIVRNMFSDYIPSSLSLLPQVDLDWNACLATLEGHSDAISSVAFSPDSQRLASGSGDKTVKLWDPIQQQASSSDVRLGRRGYLQSQRDSALVSGLESERKIVPKGLGSI